MFCGPVRVKCVPPPLLLIVIGKAGDVCPPADTPMFEVPAAIPVIKPVVEIAAVPGAEVVQLPTVVPYLSGPLLHTSVGATDPLYEMVAHA